MAVFSKAAFGCCYVVAVLVVFSLLFFPLAWFWPQWNLDHEGHDDCVVSEPIIDDYTLQFKVTLTVDGITYYNVTAGWDLEDRPMGAWSCRSVSDNLGEKFQKHMQVGDRLTCWTKKGAIKAGTTQASDIRVLVWPELVRNCWIRYAMASWVVSSVMILGGLLLLTIKLCEISDRPASDAYQDLTQCCVVFGRSQMLIWIAIAFAIFLGCYFGVVFPRIADKATCRVNDKGRRIECFMCWNAKDGHRGPQATINWCSKTSMCKASLLGDGSLYRAWVAVDYAIEGKLYSAIADWDVRGSLESLKSKLFAKGKKEKVEPFLNGITVGSEIDCWVTRYSNRVYLRDPSKQGSYVAALVCGIIFFIVAMGIAMCFCLGDHMYPWL
ncbi:uncharacterized protein AMSG_00302 [Thecamonas trahens ATCC 50062]|uniref:Uncharacterized protein n=1 Tax=Thecamonas trahens ATCC 50062 TaxID=461836 RepID=A0A0L0D4F6_THETB|nr:hypothetical protein AMSG_00302 [Thecamonas trahens ATCC 50062]KNC46183.1 hypothetical protein AMSG_00302 [Thecamonas trahens ATCC 50062]|eukprot:XP_013763158.1 hypothetical protein AMSG_00302 [Thecamonas trahens ATCC 50062]